MFQYILFDLDGTLTDPKMGITRCVQYALSTLGIDEPDLDKLEVFIGPPLQDSFQEFYNLNVDQTNQAIAKYRERFQVKGIYENELICGVKEMLETLHHHGKQLAIASSKPTPFVERILDYFQIRSFFDCIVGSNLDGTRGSKEEVVKEALRSLHLDQMADIEKKQQIAMVGDRKFDIEGAKAYGLTAVGVSFGYALHKELEEAGADVIVDTVEELTAFLTNKAIRRPSKSGGLQ